jgi:hypothetical protein
VKIIILLPLVLVWLLVDLPYFLFHLYKKPCKTKSEEELVQNLTEEVNDKMVLFFLLDLQTTEVASKRNGKKTETKKRKFVSGKRSCFLFFLRNNLFM